jgi:hypothetical protein
MTFDEVVGALQARLGSRVRLERPGSDMGACTGVLRPGVGYEEEAQGRDFPTEVAPDENGAWTFRIAPYALWFRLHAAIVSRANEDPDGRLLRIELVGGGVIVIKSLEPKN